jgi:hypothetical protein
MIRAALMKLARRRAAHREARCLAFASRTVVAQGLGEGQLNSTWCWLLCVRRGAR